MTRRKISHWPLTLLGSASSLFNLFLPIVMSRRMSAEGVGDFKVFFLYLATVPALSLGVGFTNGTYLWGADPKHATNKSRSAFLLALIAGAFASLTALAAGIFLHFTPSLFLFAFACPPAVAATIFEARLVAAGDVKKAAFFSAGFEFLRLASLLAAVLAGQGAVTLFMLHGAISWAKLIASGWVLGLISPFSPSFRTERPALLAYALPVSGAAVFDLLVLNADRYVLSVFLNAANFAIYAFGCLMVPPLFVFEQAVNQVLIPKLALTKPHTRAAPAIYRVAQEDLMLLLVPSAAGLIALADPLVRLLFTDAYRSAAPFLEFYALYYALSSIPQDVLARARSDSGWIFRTAVFFGLGALGATYAGAKMAGALGALQAFILMQIARRIYALYYFARCENAGFTKVFPVKSAAVISGAAAAGGLIAHFVSLQFSHPAHAFLAGAAAFTPVYFGIVYFLRPRALARLLRFRRSR
ncbi:MAG: lipopolysaccharide biosynthesis protein [Bdellovibrionota bacterium]